MQSDPVAALDHLEHQLDTARLDPDEKVAALLATVITLNERLEGVDSIDSNWLIKIIRRFKEMAQRVARETDAVTVSITAGPKQLAVTLEWPAR